MNGTWILVGVVYAIAVHIARRVGARFPWRIAALFYLLVLIFLFRPMTGPYVNVPADFLTNFPPWSSIVHHTPISNFELNDVVMQMVPWAHQVRDAYLTGHFPLWNALSGSGYPLLANAQSSALSPLRILTLPLPLGYAFTAEAAMKMLIAMSFMFGFCRRRWSELPSAIGAVCFGFSSFMIVWLHFPHVTTAAWIPAAILSIDLLIEQPSGRRIAGTAAAWALLLISGHPETAAHTAFVAALFLIWILFVERPVTGRDALRSIGALAVAAVLATILASPFLVPFAEVLHKSKRFQELQARPIPVAYWRDWPAIILLFEPHFLGHLPEDKAVAWPQASAESITSFAGVIGVGAWLGLLLRAIRKKSWRQREMFFILVVPILLGIILAWPGVSTLFHLVFKFAANDRLRLMLCFTSAALTAAIVDTVLVEGPLYLFIGNAATATALLLLSKLVPLSPVMRDLSLLGVLPSLAVILVSLLLSLDRYRLQATCILFVAIIAELWSATRTWNPVLPVDSMFPSTPLIRFVQKGAPSMKYRVVGISGMLFPNTQAMYGLADIRAHDPMAGGRYMGILRGLADYAAEEYFETWSNTETTLLNYLNVKYILVEPGTEIEKTRHRLVYEWKDGRVYENPDVLPRFFPVRNVILEFRHERFVRELLKHTSWSDTAILDRLPVDNDQMRQDFLRAWPLNSPEASMTIVSASDTDYTMHVRAPRYTMIVSSIPFWPGWHVEQNGKTILTRPVNGAFLGYTVPPGEWNVRVYYRPTSFYLALAAAAIAAVVGGLIATERLRLM